MTQDHMITFEGAYSRLEEILEKMNSGKLSLEDSLNLYEEADRLIIYCNSKLCQAEKKIETLVKTREGELSLSASGGVQTQPFSKASHSTLTQREIGV